jgi:hypothetical protein
MTKEQDTQRIILSRTTLHAYQRIADAGVFPVGDLGLIADEIVILKGLAVSYPNKAETLGALIEQWEALRNAAVN